MIADSHNQAVDTVAYFDSVLEETWSALREAFDVIGEIPDLCELFYGANLAEPQQAAEIVLVNMIMEITENVDRFSPWYTRPARAYGLISIRDTNTNQYKCMLAPEALHIWLDHLQKLQFAIQKNSGLIQASLLISQLTMEELSDEPQITFRCNCHPPKIIRLNQDILKKTSIICDICNYPFFPER